MNWRKESGRKERPKLFIDILHAYCKGTAGDNQRRLGLPAAAPKVVWVDQGADEDRGSGPACDQGAEEDSGPGPACPSACTWMTFGFSQSRVIREDKMQALWQGSRCGAADTERRWTDASAVMELRARTRREVQKLMRRDETSRGNPVMTKNEGSVLGPACQGRDKL